MRTQIYTRLLFVVAMTAMMPNLIAEPWLAIRYSQNCAGCHAPGRKNVEAIDRRCSLSCQGCHVSPSGGGMRNHYGKWNEDKWLASFKSSKLGHSKNFHSMKEQTYQHVSKALWPSKHVKVSKGKASKTKKKHTKKYSKKNFIKEGFGLKTKSEYMKETDYDDKHTFKVTAKNLNEFTAQIPKEDPYRQMLTSKVDAGADIRTQLYHDLDGGETHYFLMAVDFAARWRPIYKNVHVVYEARAFGGPQSETRQTLTSPSTRSLYLLVDYLPYNTYFQYGIYKPLFGNAVADHTRMSRRMFAGAFGSPGRGADYQLNFETLSVGAAPNVPFINLHYIMKAHQGGQSTDVQGIAGNLGLKFVTLGGNVNYSFWRTNSTSDAGDKTEVEMHSINIGGMIRPKFNGVTHPLVLNAEVMTLNLDRKSTDFRSTAVFSLESYFNVYKENYVTFEAAISNTAMDMSIGSSSQFKFGLRSFIMPGVDVQLGYGIDKNTVDPVGNQVAQSMNRGSITSQLHLYF